MRPIALLMLLLALLYGDHDDHREHHERHLPLDISYLDLTHEQHEKVERIIRTHLEDHRRFNRQKRETREAISRLFAAEHFDRGTFLELTARLHSESAAMQAEFLGAIHEVLTPQQRRRFVFYMQEWEIE
jgi:Spy/CpxP family protein refolding chaperone